MVKLVFKTIRGWLSQTGRKTQTKVGSSGNQPPINNSQNRKLINYWWSQIFYNDDNLKSISGSSSLKPKKGFGLIYYYLVAGKIRYIGQTREQSLKWRLTRRQKDGSIGYSYLVKRHLLNSFRAGTLEIKTQEVPLDDLGALEATEIKLHSFKNRLWNIEHNPNYKRFNRRH